MDFDDEPEWSREEPYEVDPEMTVKQLKEHIHIKSGHKPEQQKLEFAGVPLSDGMRLGIETELVK